MTMAASHVQEQARAQVDLQDTSNNAVECGKQRNRQVASTCSTVFVNSENSDTESTDTSLPEASEPSMYVVATGRVGMVFVHDPSDEDMCYKLRFEDGLQPEVDWFARTAVMVPGGMPPAPALVAAVPLVAGAAESDNRPIDESGSFQKLPDKLSGLFVCPHCGKKFDTAAALYQHDNCMDMPIDIVDAARSGNGSIDSVGLKLSGKVPCLHCSQKFDSEQALSMHCKFIHDGGSSMNVGYELHYEFSANKHIDA